MPELPLTKSELKEVRRMLNWYHTMCEAEEHQFELEEELANFPSEGDGY